MSLGPAKKSIREFGLPKPAQALIIMASVVIVIAGMRAAEAIMVPFLLSVFIAVACAPLLFWLQNKGVPKTIALLLVVLAILGFVTAVAAFIGTSLNEFTKSLPGYQAALAKKTQEWEKKLNALDERMKQFHLPGRGEEEEGGPASTNETANGQGPAAPLDDSSPPDPDAGEAEDADAADVESPDSVLLPEDLNAETLESLVSSVDLSRYMEAGGGLKLVLVLDTNGVRAVRPYSSYWDPSSFPPPPEDENGEKGLFSSINMAKYFNPGTALRLVGNTLRGLTGVMTNVFLILLTVAFILMEASSFPTKIKAVFGDSYTTWDPFNKFTNTVRRYIAIKTVFSLVTGILIAVLLEFIGVNYAVLWGFLAFLLNYIPNIGSILAAIPAVLLAIIDLGVQEAILTAVAFLAVNVTIGSITEPRFMGRGVGLSTLVVFMSLVFWGWVLGPVGMLLSVPLTMTVKIAFDSSEHTRWLSVLLSGEAAVKDLEKSFAAETPGSAN